MLYYYCKQNKDIIQGGNYIKEHKLYQCEICNTSYSDKQACKQCEECHKTDYKVINAKYLSYKQDNKGFPQSVALKFSDGNIVWYKR